MTLACLSGEARVVGLYKYNNTFTLVLPVQIILYYTVGISNFGSMFMKLALLVISSLKDIFSSCHKVYWRLYDNSVYVQHGLSYPATEAAQLLKFKI